MGAFDGGASAIPAGAANPAPGVSPGDGDQAAPPTVAEVWAAATRSAARQRSLSTDAFDRWRQRVQGESIALGVACLVLGVVGVVAGWFAWVPNFSDGSDLDNLPIYVALPAAVVAISAVPAAITWLWLGRSTAWATASPRRQRRARLRQLVPASATGAAIVLVLVVVPMATMAAAWASTASAWALYLGPVVLVGLAAWACVYGIGAAVLAVRADGGSEDRAERS